MFVESLFNTYSATHRLNMGESMGGRVVDEPYFSIGGGDINGEGY